MSINQKFNIRCHSLVSDFNGLENIGEDDILCVNIVIKNQISYDI